MKLLYEVWLDTGMRMDCIAEESLHLKKNDWLIISFDSFQDYARVIHCRGKVPDNVDIDSLPKVERRATLVDQSKANENSTHNKTMIRQVNSIVSKHDLGIHVIDHHVTFDRKKLTLKFTSPKRVDFRALVRELAQNLHVKVELRQIGVRDVAKMHGGLGTCGRVLCCSSWIHHFESVNVRMVQTQGFPANSPNINGQCGRIKCCMEFEYEGYKFMAENMPIIGSQCMVPGSGPARILDVNLLKNSMTVRLKQDGRVVEVLREELEDHREASKGQCGCGKTEGSSCGSTKQ